MWHWARRGFHELTADKPGERFARLHARRFSVHEHPLMGMLSVALGVAISLVGVVLAVMPIVPGFFLVVIGATMVVVRVKPVAHWLDRLELQFRRLIARRRRRA